MAMVAARYAMRSVRRNARRTALSVLGVAIGCLLALFMEGINRGKAELFARLGAASGTGHIRVVPAGWRERRDPRLRLADSARAFAAAAGMPDVRVVTARTRAQVLLAMGTHVVPAEIVGVLPEIEPQTFRYVRQMTRGRYLRAGETGTLVLGHALADRLDSTVDDEIVATAVGADGEIESALFRIVGIVATGTDESDASVCQVVRADVERLTGLPGAGEVSIVLRDYAALDAVRDELARRLAPGDEAITLPELVPDVEAHLEQDAASSRFVSAIILIIVMLGVASAQLAAVLERRREFAVLSALGMGAGRLIRLVVFEAMVIGAAGALVAGAAGVPLLWRLERTGIDFQRWLGSSYSFQGVLLDPVIYGSFGWWIAIYVVAVAIGATLGASLYPAVYAARTDPAVALRVAQ